MAHASLNPRHKSDMKIQACLLAHIFAHVPLRMQNGSVESGGQLEQSACPWQTRARDARVSASGGWQIGLRRAYLQKISTMASTTGQNCLHINDNSSVQPFLKSSCSLASSSAICLPPAKNRPCGLPGDQLRQIRCHWWQNIWLCKIWHLCCSVIVALCCFKRRMKTYFASPQEPNQGFLPRSSPSTGEILA